MPDFKSYFFTFDGLPEFVMCRKEVYLILLYVIMQERLNFFMKTVCDTNIWRKLVWGEVDQRKLRPPSALTATFLSVDEIVTGELPLEYPEQAKEVFLRMMKMPAKHIRDNPMVYLKKLDEPTYQQDPQKRKSEEVVYCISDHIAKGLPVDPTQYKQYIAEREKPKKELCEIWNEPVARIRKSITDFDRYRQEDVTSDNRSLISLMVEGETTKGLSQTFEWRKVELFENVLKLFFLNMVTEGLRITTNDLWDLFQLIYVQPGDKIWTYDKKLISRIRESNMKNYLFEHKNACFQVIPC